MAYNIKLPQNTEAHALKRYWLQKVVFRWKMEMAMVRDGRLCLISCMGDVEPVSMAGSAIVSAPHKTLMKGGRDKAFACVCVCVCPCLCVYNNKGEMKAHHMPSVSNLSIESEN